MASVKVDVKPAILLWVKQVLQNQQTLTKTLPEDLRLLDDWLANKSEPTFAGIERLSKHTKIPFGLFFLEKPPQDEGEAVAYRTINSLSGGESSRELIDVVHHMQLVQDWMADNRRANGFERLSFVGSLKGTKDAAAVATAIRDMLVLPRDWYGSVPSGKGRVFQYLREHAEQANILVMQSRSVGPAGNRQLQLQEFRAFVLIDDYAPLIFINANDTANGKVFSLLHELAHIWMGQNNLLNAGCEAFLTNPMETLCNAVAAEIMLPDDIFQQQWKKEQVQKLEDIKRAVRNVARYFRSGEVPVLRRALDHGYISRATYQKMVHFIIKCYKENSTKQSKQSSGGNYYATRASHWDARFLQALDASTRSGQTSYLDAYRLTKTTGRTFSKLVEYARRRMA